MQKKKRMNETRQTRTRAQPRIIPRQHRADEKRRVLQRILMRGARALKGPKHVGWNGFLVTGVGVYAPRIWVVPSFVVVFLDQAYLEWDGRRLAIWFFICRPNMFVERVSAGRETERDGGRCAYGEGMGRKSDDPVCWNAVEGVVGRHFGAVICVSEGLRSFGNRASARRFIFALRIVYSSAA